MKSWYPRYCFTISCKKVELKSVSNFTNMIIKSTNERSWIPCRIYRTINLIVVWLNVTLLLELCTKYFIYIFYMYIIHILSLKLMRLWQNPRLLFRFRFVIITTPITCLRYWKRLQLWFYLVMIPYTFYITL